MKSVFLRIFMLILWLIPTLVFSLAFRYLFDSVYHALHAHFKDVFPLFSPITQEEQYAVYDGIMSALTLLATFLLTVYLSILTSNDRYEEVISKTDGLYDIKDAIPLYKPVFIIGDATASLIIALLLTLPMPFIPEKFFSYTVTRALVMPRAVCSLLPGALGVALGAVIIFATVLLSHIPAVIFSLKAWRARWLSSFAS